VDDFDMDTPPSPNTSEKSTPDNNNDIIDLSDMLILSIENEREFFLVVNVKFAPTIPGVLVYVMW
jgi:hypothetical protein